MQVQLWLEKCFRLTAARVNEKDFSYLEVFIEIIMCLTVMASPLVKTVGLPQVNALIWIVWMDAH